MSTLISASPTDAATLANGASLFQDMYNGDKLGASIVAAGAFSKVA